MANTVAFGKDFSFLLKIAEDKRKLCIYGCGVNGEVICEFLRGCNKDIEFFVDEQAASREFSVLNKRVISLENFFEQSNELLVIVSQDNQEPIIKMLIENGINKDNIISPFKKIEVNVNSLEQHYGSERDMHVSVKHKGNKVPVVTVFTIIYNTPAEMLCRSIESVLTQTFDDFIYLIIDNGSTDGSSDIIKQYAERDSRIRYVRLQSNVIWANGELLEALKCGIETPYVAMLDSDDYYESDFLEKVIKIAHSDESDIVQVETLTYGHDGFRYNYFTQSLGRNICFDGDEIIRYFMLRILNVPVWGKLYKSSIFKNLFDMMLSYESEYERDRNFCLDISWMTYLALSSKRVSVCDDILHVRTWRPGSSEHSDEHGSKWLSSMIWSFEYLRKYGVDEEKLQVFEEAALMWLFSLTRDKYDLSSFRSSDLKDKAVKQFMTRPVCDKYRG